MPLETDADDYTQPELAVIDDPLLDLTRREGIDALRRAVQALPRRYREVVVLCDLEEVDYADAAVALGCPIGTVRSRLHRARGLLLEKLQPGAESPAGSWNAQAGEVRVMNCQEFWNTIPELGECAGEPSAGVPRLCGPYDAATANWKRVSARSPPAPGRWKRRPA